MTTVVFGQGAAGAEKWPVDTGSEADIFGNGVSSPRYNQIEVDHSVTDPDANTDVTVTKTLTGDASNVTGHAKFETGANTNGRIQCASVLTVDYRPSHEIYAAFTAAFTTGIANSYQRIGLFSSTDGFFIGFESTAFGVTARFNSGDTRIAQAAFSDDKLDGGGTSKFTRNGTPEALDPTKSNLYRVRFGWFGSAPVVFEVYSPDEKWVPFHRVKFPNSQLNPSLTTTILPIALDVRKVAGGVANLIVYSGCWAAGTTSALQTLTATLTDRTLAQTVRAVITGQTTAGGGGFVNVKVNPSGTLAIGNTSVGPSGSAVPAEATYLGADNGAGVLAGLSATDRSLNVADSGEREYTHKVATVTAIGDTTIHTPAAGKSIRLHWIYAINDPTASSSPLMKISLGANEYFRMYAISKRQRITGPVNGALVINLSQDGNVAVTAILEEV